MVTKMVKLKNLEKQFSDIIELIIVSKNNATRNVNNQLVQLYWNIGKYIYERIITGDWGKNIVVNLAIHVQKKIPNKGFSAHNLWRMKKFYDTYKLENNLLPTLKQLSWSSNLHIISKTKTMKAKKFYAKLAIKERYSVRELQRQIDSCFYERYILSDSKLSPSAQKIHPNIDSLLRDNYLIEFLELPSSFSEKDLQKTIIQNLKSFFLEFGKDFAFVGEEYRVQVGNRDFFIDLLFFHRELCCLVAIELKIDEFQPEYLGKLNFYLEALDQNVKKVHENPSVGIILCASKDNEVVEYSLNRNISPALVAQYQTKLIEKKILQKKFHEFVCLSLEDTSDSHQKKSPILKLNRKSLEILKFCNLPQKRKDVLKKIGLTNQSKNFNNHILPLLQAQYLEFTIPDKPKSKNQKYQTTNEGRKIFPHKLPAQY